MRSENVGTIILLLLSIAVIVQSSQYSMGSSLKRVGPGFFPMILAISMAIVSLSILIQSILDPVKDSGFKKPKSWLGFIMVVGSILAYGFFLQYLGFFITTFLFAFSLFKFGYPSRWFMPITGGIVTAIITFLIFSAWLNTPFPKGLLGF